MDNNWWILLLTALVVSSVGFYRQVYFISIGYGLSVAAIGAALLILYRGAMNIVNIIQPLLLIIYGLRLTGYLLYRELTVESFQVRTDRKGETERSSILKVSIPMWISVALMYFALTSPVYFRLYQGGESDLVTLIGIVIMAAGIAVEAIADWTKYNHKKKNPDTFCSKGLYSIVRYPNYFGEMLLWTGVYMSFMSFSNGILQWFIASGGYACILYVMVTAARDLEKRQNKKYSANSKYKQYVKNTPILIPWIRMYTLKKRGS